MSSFFTVCFLLQYGGFPKQLCNVSTKVRRAILLKRIKWLLSIILLLSLYRKDDSQQNQESDYPVTTKRTKFLLQISPVCQVTATLFRLYLNFQSDLLDNAHLVGAQWAHREIRGEDRRRWLPAVCPRCGSALRSPPRICSRGTKQHTEPLHILQFGIFSIWHLRKLTINWNLPVPDKIDLVADNNDSLCVEVTGLPEALQQGFSLSESGRVGDAEDDEDTVALWPPAALPTSLLSILSRTMIATIFTKVKGWHRNSFKGVHCN